MCALVATFAFSPRAAHAQAASARSQAQERAAQEELAKAHAHLQAGRAAEAEASLARLTAAHPDLAHAHRLHGHALAELGRVAEARAAFGRALALGPLAPDALLRLAVLEAESGRPREAWAALSFAHGAASASGTTSTLPLEVALLQADLETQLGWDDAAEVTLLALAEREPAEAAVHLRVGNLRMRQRKPWAAVAALETAYHLGDPTPALAATIAELLIEGGELEAAARWFERAAARATADRDAKDAANATASAHLRLAEVWLALGDHDRAARAGRAALAAALASDARAHAVLGKIALAAGRPDDAITSWEAALALGEPGDDVAHRLAALHARAQRFDRAALLLEGYLAARPSLTEGDRPPLALLISCLLESGETERASAHLERFIARFGLDADALSLIDRLARRSG